MGSFLMLVNSVLSTAFWSLARALETSFFCEDMYVSMRFRTTPSFLVFPSSLSSFLFFSFLYFGQGNTVAHLGFLPLLEKGLLSDLIGLLLPGEISLLGNLLHHLLVDPL